MPPAGPANGGGGPDAAPSTAATRGSLPFTLTGSSGSAPQLPPQQFAAPKPAEHPSPFTEWAATFSVPAAPATPAAAALPPFASAPPEEAHAGVPLTGPAAAGIPPPGWGPPGLQTSGVPPPAPAYQWAAAPQRPPLYQPAGGCTPANLQACALPAELGHALAQLSTLPSLPPLSRRPLRGHAAAAHHTPRLWQGTGGGGGRRAGRPAPGRGAGLRRGFRRWERRRIEAHLLHHVSCDM